jgi:hypothetical protein
LKQELPTQTTPSRLTAGKGLSPLWKVECQVLGTAYPHTWAGEAVDHADAKRQAVAAARRDWPGFSFCVRSVVQVAG